MPGGNPAQNQGPGATCFACARPVEEAASNGGGGEPERGAHHVGMVAHTQKRLNLWKINLQNEAKEVTAFMGELVWFIPVLIILGFLTVTTFPDASISYRQKEVIRTLVLEDEIADPSDDYAKSSLEVESIDDVWLWAENNLLGSLYAEAPNEHDACGNPVPGWNASAPAAPLAQAPELVFGHGILVGSITVRQARSFRSSRPDSAHGCPEVTEAVWAAAGVEPEPCFDEWTRVALPRYQQDHSLDPAVSNRTAAAGNETDVVSCAGCVFPFGKTALCPPEENATTNFRTFGCEYLPVHFATSLRGSSTFTDDATEGTTDYGDEGFQVVIPRNREAAFLVLRQLKADFVDRSTRALAFDINLYNVDDDLFVVLQVSFLFDVTGQIEPFYRVQAMRPMTEIFFSNTPEAKVVIGFYLAWQILLAIRELRELELAGFWPYITQFWNDLEVFFFISNALLIANAVSYMEASNDMLDELAAPAVISNFTEWVVADPAATAAPGGEPRNVTLVEGLPISFMELRSKFRWMKIWFGLTWFVSCFKIFKYLQLHRDLNMLWRLLEIATWKIVSFIFIMLGIIYSFALLAVYAFGYHSRMFHNSLTAMNTLVHMAMGDLHYGDAYNVMQEVRTEVSWVFLACFKVTVILVTVNMFVAVLGSGYELASEEVKTFKAVHKAERGDQAAERDLQSVQSGTKLGLVDVLTEVWRLFKPQFQVVADFSHEPKHERYEGNSFNYPSTNLQQGSRVQILYQVAKTSHLGGPGKPQPLKDRVQAYKDDLQAYRDGKAKEAGGGGGADAAERTNPPSPIHLRIAPRYSTELRATSRYLSYLVEGDQVTLHEPTASYDESIVLRFDEHRSIFFKEALKKKRDNDDQSAATTFAIAHKTAVFKVEQLHTWDRHSQAEKGDTVTYRCQHCETEYDPHNCEHGSGKPYAQLDAEWKCPGKKKDGSDSNCLGTKKDYMPVATLSHRFTPDKDPGPAIDMFLPGPHCCVAGCCGCRPRFCGLRCRSCCLARELCSEWLGEQLDEKIKEAETETGATANVPGGRGGRNRSCCRELAVGPTRLLKRCCGCINLRRAFEKSCAPSDTDLVRQYLKEMDRLVMAGVQNKNDLEEVKKTFDDFAENNPMDLATFAARFRFWLELRNSRGCTSHCHRRGAGGADRAAERGFEEDKDEIRIGMVFCPASWYGREITGISSTDIFKILAGPEFSHAIDASTVSAEAQDAVGVRRITVAQPADAAVAAADAAPAAAEATV
eukprot:SAG22_NODE_1394_length_4512_cov_2.230455_2_plen_1247_part_01